MNASASPDTQLEYELQDLYISSKHLLSDIDFLSDEIRFFKYLIDRCFIPDSKNKQEILVKSLRRMILQEEGDTLFLQNKIKVYLKFLEPFINNQSKPIGLDLIRKHTRLESDIRNLSDSIKYFKKELFSLTEQII